ncbi:MAG: ABC transporter transmembrane domain-containing protein [Planctomycetota bacterium]|jgi:ATP-binding cassette subfamily B protein
MIAHVHEDEFGGRFDWGVWRRIVRHARPYRRSLAGLAGSGLVLAIIDTFFPLVTGMLIDEATEVGVTMRLLGLGAAYLSLVVGLSACVWVFIVLAGRTATGIAHDLRRAGFARLQELSFSYYDRHAVGWLVSRLTADCAKLSSLMPWFILDLFWGSTLVIGIVVAMCLLHWPLAVIVLIIVPLLVGATIFFQHKLLDSSRKVRRSNSLITASYNESLMGVRTTKALVREEDNLGEFEQLSGDMRTYATRNALQSAVYLPIVISLGSVGVGLALWRGGIEVGAGLTLGTLVAFSATHPRCVGPLPGMRASAPRRSGTAPPTRPRRPTGTTLGSIASSSATCRSGTSRTSRCCSTSTWRQKRR